MKWSQNLIVAIIVWDLREDKNEKMDAKEDWTTHHENSMFTSFSQDIKHSYIRLTRLSTVLTVLTDN